jgi:chromosome segregation ATPase
VYVIEKGDLGMKKSILVAFCMSIILLGCENERTTSSEVDNDYELQQLKKELMEEITKLEIKLSDRDRSIKELNEELEALKNDHSQLIDEVRNIAYMNDHLIKNLQNIVRKQGYVTDFNETSNYIIVDYAEMVNDEDAPNGFHLKNIKTEADKLIVPDDLAVYLLEGATIRYSSIEEMRNSSYPRLYNFYFVDQKLTLIVEQYLP